MIHAAVGIIRNTKGEVLIAERPETKYKGGCWEFPGGKVEESENVFQALQREMKEELDIHVIAASPWLKFQHHYPDRIVLLDTWNITEFSGIPKGAEGQSIRWVALHDLHQFEFPEGNCFILDQLKAF